MLSVLSQSGVLLQQRAGLVARRRGDSSLESDQLLNNFLASVEKRALRMAMISTGNQDDGLDIVQDAMMKLAKSYGNRDPEQWPPLFYRILQNAITDWHRRQKSSSHLKQWFGFGSKDDDEGGNPVDSIADQHGHLPEQNLQEEQAMNALNKALHQLPLRQQQAFMLRLWEGFDVAQTAKAMGCSQGSVKTHYSRAIHSLREKLEGNWP